MLMGLNEGKSTITDDNIEPNRSPLLWLSSGLQLYLSFRFDIGGIEFIYTFSRLSRQDISMRPVAYTASTRVARPADAKPVKMMLAIKAPVGMNEKLSSCQS